MRTIIHDTFMKFGRNRVDNILIPEIKAELAKPPALYELKEFESLILNPDVLSFYIYPKNGIGRDTFIYVMSTDPMRMHRGKGPK